MCQSICLCDYCCGFQVSCTIHHPKSCAGSRVFVEPCHTPFQYTTDVHSCLSQRPNASFQRRICILICYVVVCISFLHQHTSLLVCSIGPCHLLQLVDCKPSRVISEHPSILIAAIMPVYSSSLWFDCLLPLTHHASLICTRLACYPLTRIYLHVLHNMNSDALHNGCGAC